MLELSSLEALSVSTIFYQLDLFKEIPEPTVDELKKAERENEIVVVLNPSESI